MTRPARSHTDRGQMFDTDGAGTYWRDVDLLTPDDGATFATVDTSRPDPDCGLCAAGKGSRLACPVCGDCGETDPEPEGPERDDDDTFATWSAGDPYGTFA